MIRVLFINHSTIIGGAETNLLNILRFADLGDFQPVGVLLPDDGPLSLAVSELGYPVGFIQYHALTLANPFRFAQTIRQLIGWFLRTNADVIHLNHQWLVRHSVIAARLARRPIICHTRNYLDVDFVRKEETWLRRSNKILTVSNAANTRAVELGLPAEHVTTVYDGLDLSRFEVPTSPTQNSVGMQPSYPTVGFCGRLVSEKGPEDLIESVPYVLRTLPETQFVFVGKDQTQGRYVAHLQERARRLGVTDHVGFSGFRTDTEQLLATFDVLTVPSRPEMPEGLPLAVLEGLVAGCMVVATPNSGIPEAVIDGETGFLVEPENPRALGQAIVRALTLPLQERARIQHNGRELVKVKFSIERQVISLGKIYEELVR